jgi:hypothetical protein
VPQQSGLRTMQERAKLVEGLGPDQNGCRDLNDPALASTGLAVDNPPSADGLEHIPKHMFELGHDVVKSE